MVSGRTVVVVTILAVLWIIATPSVARANDPDGGGEDGPDGLGALPSAPRPDADPR